MAFDFLNLAAGIYGQMQANKAVKKYNVPTAAETQSAQLYAALADPNSQLVQQFQKQEQEQGMAAFLSQLRSMQGADRRQQALGRSPTFFNPERADEAVSFLTSRGMPGIAANAKTAALNRILAAANGIQTNQGPQADRLKVAGGQAISNAAYIPAAVMKAFGQTQQPQQQQSQDIQAQLNSMLGKPAPYGPQLPIQWNQSR